MDLARECKRIFLLIVVPLVAFNCTDGQEVGYQSGPAAVGLSDGNSRLCKVYVSSDGLYRIDSDHWRQMGVDPTQVDPRNVRVFNEGREVPTDITGWKVAFYGRRRRDDGGFYSRDGREGVYWLSWEGKPGFLMPTRDVAPALRYPPSATYRQIDHIEYDRRYEPLGLAGEADRDHWFWERLDVAAGWQDFVFKVDGYNALVAGPIAVRVGLRGVTDFPGVNPDHHVVVAVDRQIALGVLKWDGGKEALFEGRLPWPLISNGRYRLSFRLTGETSVFDSVLLNWFEIDYDREHLARAGELLFTERYGPGQGKRVAVTGFTRPYVRLYDLSRGCRLTGFGVKYEKNRRYTITFEDTASGPVTYYAVQDDRIHRPLQSRMDRPSSLADPDHEVDYLIVTHADFASALEPLIRLHEAEGLRVETVDVEDVYDEFGAGLPGPAPVREFIRYASARWRRTPQYVLLVGDESVDHRGALGSGRASFVPALYFQSSQRGESPTDNLYACVRGDDLVPDLFIGRLPVGTPDEARAAVRKLVDAEEAPPVGEWRRRVVYFADRDPFFQQSSDTLLSRFSGPAGLSASRVYAKGTSEDRLAAVNALNQGCALLNFVGHGSATLMASFLSSSPTVGGNLSLLQNGGMLPLVLAFSCLNGAFADPGIQALGEAMVNMPQGGAKAYIASSTLGWTIGDQYLDEAIFETIFVDGERRYGAILARAKAKFAGRYSNSVDFLNGYNLFGDPAGTLPFDLPDVAGKTERGGVAEGEAGTGDSGKQAVGRGEDGPPGLGSVLNVPNPISGAGTTFTYALGSRASVSLRVYALSGRMVASVAGASGDAGFNEVIWDGLDDRGRPIANGVYIYRVVARNRNGRDIATERLVVMR